MPTCATFANRRKPKIQPYIHCALIFLCSVLLNFSRASTNPSKLPLAKSPDFQTYANSISSIRLKANEAKCIRYSEVLTSIYKGDIEALIARKIQWQKSQPLEYQFYSDYSTANSKVDLTEFAAKPNPTLGSILIGRYEAYSNRIEISPNSTNAVVVHEVGHSLQRTALIKGHSPRNNFDPSNESFAQLHDFQANTPKAKRDKQRLRYLLAQNELEVRLQDLNRLYALYNEGQPVETPLETLQALSLLGLRLDPATVQQALAYTDWASELESIKLHLSFKSHPKDQPEVEKNFEDAFELILLEKLVRRHRPEAWQGILRKLLLEAPGHL